MLTLDQLGISEEDWNQTPASVRVALMFLLQQNQRLENRCATYELQVQRLEVELQASLKIGVSQVENVMTVSANTPPRHDFVLKSALMTV